MNLTVQLVADPLWFILVGLVSLTALYMAWTALQILDRWVTLYGQRKETPAVWPSSPPPSPTVQVGPMVQEVRKPASVSVPEVDPATILRRAPKPAGFSGAGDGSGQPEPAGSPPGGDDQKGPAPSCPVVPGGRKL